MGYHSAISILVLCFLCCSCSLILAQQPYVGKVTTNCSNTADSALGYSCNGLNSTCQAYLIFRSQPPYTTVSSISTLFGSDPSQVSAINSVSANATFDTNKMVIIPATCSCSGQYYQANTSYVVESGNTDFFIANNTYQGLSTCQALQDQNKKLTNNIYAGETLTVPLRCACPTKNQTDEGIKYLLSYAVTSGDTVSIVSAQFGSDTGLCLQANELSEQSPTIYPFTTLLIPLQTPPTSSETLVPPPPAVPPSSSSPPIGSSDKGSTKTWIYGVVGAIAGAVLMLFIGAIIFFVCFRRRKRSADPNVVSESFEAHEKPDNKKVDGESQEFWESLSSVAQSIKVYKFEELQAATDNFSPGCWIQGSVYRGLINGDYAAIKKTNGDVSKEINLLNKINHSNLIRLSGVCFNDGNWYLVYEFAVNGPLCDWIYNSTRDAKFLNWTQRLQIALDVATGLNYLHSFTNPPHIHKDIKSSNVLLDSDFRAKIANLSLARSAEGREGEFTLTRHIVGTKGHMAPEYLENGLVSTKLDVYAFGVLMLEIITGKEVAALYTDENTNLPDMLHGVLSKENEQESVRQLIDPSLRENCPLELASLVVRLIHACLSKNPAERPTMEELVGSISRILNTFLNWELSVNISGHQSLNRT